MWNWEFFSMENNIINDHGWITVSVDRLTVVGDYLTQAFNKNYYEWQRKYDFVKPSGKGLQIIDTTGYLNTSSTRFGEQVAYIEVPPFQRNKIRIDFNPNHGLHTSGGKWLLSLISSIENKHFSRGDFAFDIFNNPRAYYYRVWNFGISKRIFLDRKGEVQTIYYGSSASGKQIRQYNKLAEQISKGNDSVNVNSWWRLELQLRSNVVSDYPTIVRDMLKNFYVPDYDKVKSVQQKAVIFWLVNCPESWGELNERSRTRYHKIFRELPKENDLAIEMAQEFLAQFDRLKNELETIMNRFNIKATEN